MKPEKIPVNLIIIIILLSSLFCKSLLSKKTTVNKIPVIYSSDLYHPHGDPDDHFDLATLFAIREFNIRGIIIDGGEYKGRMGEPPIKQMMHLTGQSVPYSIGLKGPFKNPGDKLLEEPDEFQGGVRLILSILRETREKVVIITVGSSRDMAAAYNREPELFRKKVRAYYLSGGVEPPDKYQNEANVRKEPYAYYRIMSAGLPIYWNPCQGAKYGTRYFIDKPEFIRSCTPKVQNYLIYCFSKIADIDPVHFLKNRKSYPFPEGKKGMWSTFMFFHAAGRKIYERARNDFIVLPPREAEKQGLDKKKIDILQYTPVHLAGEKPISVSRTDMKRPPAGKIAAYDVGGIKDIGKLKLKFKQGERPLKCIRLLGIQPGKSIENIIVSIGRPKKMLFREYKITQKRSGPLDYKQEGSWVNCYFPFIIPGKHKIEIIYKDNSHQACSFPVFSPWGYLNADFKSDKPNGFISRRKAGDEDYERVLVSCLKNLLSALGR